MRVKLASAVLLAVVGSLHGVGSLARAPGGYAGTLRIDGVETRIEESYLAAPADLAAREYQARWRVDDPSSVVAETVVAGTHVLGQRRGRSYRTAQFSAEPDGRTRVLVAHRDLVAAPRREPPPLPLPRGTRVIRELAMSEGSQAVLQIYSTVPASRASTMAALLDAARRAGWGPAAAQRASERGESAVLAWRRGGDELLIAVGGAGMRTTLLVHAVRESSSAGARP